MPNRSESSLKVDAGGRDACTEVSRSASIESKSAIAEENIVLRKLLRKWRYFDSGDENFHLEGHAVKSPPKNQRKRCYVCGDVQHTGKKCRKRRTCYFCNERGHLAEDCPKSNQEYNICLRCGESGHDLFSCNNDYPPDDLKNIVCYICNKGGHICCHTCTNISPDTVSCYNCGESGHSGVQCPKPHMDKKSSRPPSLCYKCGEEGHAARKCGVPVQNKHQQSEG